MSTDQLVPVELSAEQARALAAEYGLQPLGVRPSLGSYLRDTWKCRGFIYSLSAGRSTAKNNNNYFGQAWSLLNPALNILVYYIIFGLVLSLATGRGGVTDYIGFLSIGIVTFQMTSSMLTQGSTSVVRNPSLVRALRFPRCVLPLSVAMTELLSTVPAFVVVLGVMLIRRDWPTWWWLLYPFGIAINVLIGTGFALMLARVVNSSRDLANMVLVATRLLRYGAGVMIPLEGILQGHTYIKHHEWIATVLNYEPFALQLTLIRQTVMRQFHPTLLVWSVCIGWAILIPVVGMIVFWRGEENYGRG